MIDSGRPTGAPIEPAAAGRAASPGALVRVVVFTGGRGSSVLSRRLIVHPRVQVILAINGYDDGASTGEVRRFLGDCLGPSDFRKNASRLATELQSCHADLIALLDHRLPAHCPAGEGAALVRHLGGEPSAMATPWQHAIAQRLANLPDDDRQSLARAFAAFAAELDQRGEGAFDFHDCALGNIAFAGCFLAAGRHFNQAIDAYCALLHLPAGLILNVTNGENAFLVAVDSDHRLLTTEAAIVGGTHQRRIRDIHLIDRPPDAAEERWLETATPGDVDSFLARHATTPSANPDLVEALAAADLIIYAPGTQHSSLFPSYLVPGLGHAIAGNLRAIKVLITNLREDMETRDTSAVEIIDRALYYLTERHTRSIPTPCLITHYLLNDPERDTEERPYVPLGRLDSLEDPRLVRIGNYEEGSSGVHDASKVLLPFIDLALRAGDRQAIAIWLLDSQSLNTVTQTILEAYRGGLGSLPFDVTFFYHNGDSLPESFTSGLPFAVHNVARDAVPTYQAFMATIANHAFEYVIQFDSSGMYKGEDIINLASFLTNRRLDAVWGSRRLSMTDIRESYKLRYRHNVVMGAISYVGSHLLSLACLLRYGRYVSDTLCSIRAVRTSWLRDAPVPFDSPGWNQWLLSRLLSRRAEIIETPVQFFPLAPEKARRTTVWGGLKSLAAALAWPSPTEPADRQATESASRSPAPRET